MIRKKRMSKGIAKILSGLLIFGMVAGLIPTVPGGIVHAKASEISGQNATADKKRESRFGYTAFILNVFLSFDNLQFS